MASSIEASGMLTDATNVLATPFCTAKHCRHPWLFVVLQSVMAFVVTLVLIPAISNLSEPPPPTPAALGAEIRNRNKQRTGWRRRRRRVRRSKENGNRCCEGSETSFENQKAAAMYSLMSNCSIVLLSFGRIDVQTRVEYTSFGTYTICTIACAALPCILDRMIRMPHADSSKRQQRVEYVHVCYATASELSRRIRGKRKKEIHSLTHSPPAFPRRSHCTGASTLHPVGKYRGRTTCRKCRRQSRTNSARAASSKDDDVVVLPSPSFVFVLSESTTNTAPGT